MIFQESETVELKSMVVDDIKKEIIAFANCDGGTLYVGIADDGTVVGVESPDQTALQISNMVRDAVKPDLTMFLHYKTLDIEGKNIIVVEVQRGTNRPYYISKKGLRPEGVYVRQGYSSVPATDTAIRSMIKETDGDRFEDMRSIYQELSFDVATLEFQRRKIAFAMPQKKTLGLINQDGMYTNLGLLLSDQCLHTIKAAVFEGTGQSIFKDRREFTGSLFKQMQEVYEFIDFRNQTRSVFEKLYRVDTRDYPDMAIREAMLNCLVHREYAISASTLISIFSNRIEFTSIGGIVPGVTLNDIWMGISVCRNAKLANVFYRLELIEAYGTGMHKIMEAYEGTGCKPRIEVSDNVFKIILPNINYLEEKNSEQEILEREPSEQIVILLKKHGELKRKELQELLELSQTTCGRTLKEMIQSGQITQIGKGKNIRYRLV